MEDQRDDVGQMLSYIAIAVLSLHGLVWPFDHYLH
jgi:hypothetical protein